MKNTLRIALILSLLLPLMRAGGAVRAAHGGNPPPQETPTPQDRARLLLGKLTPQ